jgi:hypothetical protein
MAHFTLIAAFRPHQSGSPARVRRRAAPSTYRGCMSTSDVSTLTDTTRPSRRTDPWPIAAAIGAAVLTLAAALWLILPALNPFGSAAAYRIDTPASAWLGAQTAAILCITLGVASLLALKLHGGWRALAGAVLVPAVALTLGSSSVLSIVGYFFGVAAVIAGVVTVVVIVVRHPKLGLPLLAGLAVLVIAAALQGATVNAVLDFAMMFATAIFERSADVLVVGIVLLSTVTWTAVAVRSFRATRRGASFEGWLVRHRILLTILAAIGPLPYALARLTWLTPWPLFGPTGAELATMPEIRITGLIIGSGAAAAIILTLGLILPWGRTFPQWMPRLGGRPVPVAAAAVPGLTAAGVLTIAAVPTMLLSLEVALLLPLWFWGPALGLAVWGYVAWRARERQP